MNKKYMAVMSCLLSWKIIASWPGPSESRPKGNAKGIQYFARVFQPHQFSWKVALNSVFVE